MLGVSILCTTSISALEYHCVCHIGVVMVINSE